MQFEIIPASGGYRARIRDGNDEIIFTSKIHKSKAYVKSLIAVVANAAATAKLEDKT